MVFHANKKCSGLQSKELQEMTKNNNIIWFCVSCVNKRDKRKSGIQNLPTTPAANGQSNSSARTLTASISEDNISATNHNRENLNPNHVMTVSDLFNYMEDKFTKLENEIRNYQVENKLY